MAETIIDGAVLSFPVEVEIVETLRFIDRRYLGVVTRRAAADIFYASLMRRAEPQDDPYFGVGMPYWAVHTLNAAMTDSISHAKHMIISAYEALDDRLAKNS